MICMYSTVHTHVLDVITITIIHKNCETIYTNYLSYGHMTCLLSSHTAHSDLHAFHGYHPSSCPSPIKHRLTSASVCTYFEKQIYIVYFARVIKEAKSNINLTIRKYNDDNIVCTLYRWVNITYIEETLNAQKHRSLITLLIDNSPLLPSYLHLHISVSQLHVLAIWHCYAYIIIYLFDHSYV